MRSVDREHCYHFYRRLQLLWKSATIRTSHSWCHILPNPTSKSNNNIQKPLACVAKWLLKDFQGMVSSVASRTPWCSLLLAHSLLDSTLCAHVLEAAPAVCLHVPHSTDGLDLGVVGSPVVPVLVRSHLKHVLVATVAGVLVSHPAVWGSREKTRVNHKHLLTFSFHYPLFCSYYTNIIM